MNLKLDHPELCKAGSFDFSEIKNSLRDKHWEADSEGLDKRNMRELDETQELDEA